MSEKMHSNIGASSSHRWTNCPGSVALIATCPPAKESSYAKEGTAAHELAQVCLLKGKPARHYLGQPMGGGLVISEDMADAVQVYLDTVLKDKEEVGKGRLVVETSFDLSELHPGLYGTNDAMLMQEYGKLTVYDYKHGAGVPVEVKDNPQLLYYALGALLQGDYDPVEVVIVQPRAPHRDGPVRRFTYSQKQVLEFGQWLVSRVKETKKRDAALVAGHWCKFCPATSKCPAVMQQIQEAAKTDFAEASPKLPKPANMDMDRLVKVLSLIPLMDDWVRAVEEEAETRAKRGERIPGFKLVKKKSNRAWIDEKAAETEFVGYLGDKAYAPRKILSPAQMEKAGGKHLSIVVDALCHNPDTGECLVTDSDPRPAVNPALDFEKV